MKTRDVLQISGYNFTASAASMNGALRVDLPVEQVLMLMRGWRTVL
jgi:hypothetical protein